MTKEQLEKDIEEMKKALNFLYAMIQLWLDAWKQRFFEGTQLPYKVKEEMKEVKAISEPD